MKCLLGRFLLVQNRVITNLAAETAHLDHGLVSGGRGSGQRLTGPRALVSSTAGSSCGWGCSLMETPLGKTGSPITWLLAAFRALQALQ